MAANGETNRERENRNRCRSAAAAAAAVAVLSPTKGKVCGDGDNGESAKRSSPLLLLRSRSRKMSGMMRMTITGFCKVGKRANDDDDDDLLYDIYDSRFSLSATRATRAKARESRAGIVCCLLQQPALRAWLTHTGWLAPVAAAADFSLISPDSLSLCRPLILTSILLASFFKILPDFTAPMLPLVVNPLSLLLI